MNLMHRFLSKSSLRQAGADAGAGALIPRIFSQLLGRSFSQLTGSSSHTHTRTHSIGRPCSFGIAFDIDGVLLRGHSPIGGSPTALSRLYDHSGSLKIPYIFLTNGGGVRESKRAIELSELFGVKVVTSQVLHGHSPFKQLANRFENDFVVAVGKGEPAAVMSEYGFKEVISIDEYALCFDNIDPLAPNKKWMVNRISDQSNSCPGKDLKNYVCSQRVQAVFIVSDPVDWSRDIQVLCDILRSGGLPGAEIGTQPSMYFAHDDLKYQGAFPVERFGMGAFRIALQSVFNSIHPHPLQYTAVGKPNPLAFKNAEATLRQLCTHELANQDSRVISPFETLYMIGDNPSVDIKGAKEAGHPWFSILTRTGVFRGKANDHEYPADMVVDTVEEAVNFILEKEGIH